MRFDEQKSFLASKSLTQLHSPLGLRLTLHSNSRTAVEMVDDDAENAAADLSACSVQQIFDNRWETAESVEVQHVHYRLDVK